MFINCLISEWNEKKESEEEFNARASRLIEEQEKEWEKSRKKYFETTGNVLKKLAKEGWFMPMYQKCLVGELRDIRKLVNKTREEVDLFCCEFYEKRFQNISSEVEKAFPTRQNVIREACEAHKLKMYFLSVPVFLSQADGIFAEYAQIKQGVFGRKNDKPVSELWITGQSLDEFLTAYMTPFCMLTALNMSQEDRNRAGVTINRHAVLHGEWTDYGTYINSLKALSFLNFVITALECLEIEKENESDELIST